MASLCPHCKLPLSHKESSGKTCPICRGNLDGSGAPPTRTTTPEPILEKFPHSAPTSIPTLTTSPEPEPFEFTTASSQTQPTRGLWFVPLPPQRLALARGAAVVGIVSSLLLFLFFGGFILLFPLIKGPVDIGGLVCLGPTGGLTLALLVHFFGCRRGYRLSALGWFVIPLLFFGTAYLINRFSPDRTTESIKQQILAGQAGEPEFAPDPELKNAFVAIVDGLKKDSKPTLYFRVVEKHETEPPPDTKTALLLWKLDPQFAEFTRLKMEIPGSQLSCTDIGPSRFRQRFETALRPIIPEKRLKFEYLSSTDSPEGKFIVDVAATTRHEGTFSKLTSTMKPRLQPNFRIDWQFRVLGRDGTPLYSHSRTNKPSSSLSFKEIPIGLDSTVTRLMQLSAHDNFIREILGRLGLPPGPEKTEWSGRDY